MFNTLAIICAVVLFVGLSMVLIDINGKLSEIGTGLFVIGVCAFIFFMVFGKLYSVPVIITTDYYASECNLDDLAVQHNAKVVSVNRDEKVVHRYSKKDNVDEWIYYKFDEQLLLGTSSTKETTTNETEKKVENGYG